jgi:hypothetical protein
MICNHCGGIMRVVSFITERERVLVYVHGCNILGRSVP